MRRPRSIALVLSLLLVTAPLLVAPGLLATVPASGGTAAHAALATHDGHDREAKFRVLVYSRTAGYRHESIPAGIAALRELGAKHGFSVDATEDPAAFTDDNLAHYQVVVFLSTTGDVLGTEQQQAFQRYIRDGGAWVGIHAASDTEYSWPFYGRLVGAYFKSHPHVQTADVVVEDTEQPATAGLPERWTRTDEWYNFKAPEDGETSSALAEDYSPRSEVHVLASLDESSYVELDGSDHEADDHAIAWCQEIAGGRSFYTGGGHTVESYSEPAFRSHLAGMVRSAAGVVASDCAPPVATEPPPDENFEQVTLATGQQQVGEPIGMAVLPGGRVLHSARGGRLFLSSEGGGTSLAADIPVYRHDEEGLQGIALDPDFESNRWVYLMYAPPLDTPVDDPNTPGTNEGDAPGFGTEKDWERFRGYTLVSRFKLENDRLQLDTEQEILRVPADRGLCCHVGGDLLFDADGNLLISTGDDTNPFESDGYTPIDERPGRNPAFDAQRSAGNTSDLRGKILRIRPDNDGSYTIPAGNLFGEQGKYPDADPAKVREEIYAMGFRNPFRMGLDPKTGWLYVGEYGPDAASADEDRGPGGMVEVLQIREPGNYGWPYCAGPNKAYNDYDFATGESGPKFDCAAPVNESPNNTGLRQLPPAKLPWIWYDGGTVHYNGKSTDEFGNGSESPMGGPVYRYDPTLQSDTKFPPYFDGHFFLGEWGRGWIKEITIGPEGEPAEIEPFFDSGSVNAPMDFEFGPDGALYVLDYGSGSYSGSYTGGSPDAAVHKINYVKGGRSPVVRVEARPTTGMAPLTVTFTSDGTHDPDGDELSYAWDFDQDGTTDSTEPDPEHVYNTNGTHTARLTVTDSTGKTGSAAVSVVVGNERPTVRLEPVSGGVFDYGDRLAFTVEVTDAQDGEIDCGRVRVHTALGHNEHAHGDQSFAGCSGVVTVPERWEPDTQSSFYVISASYTDNGGANGAPALTGGDTAILQPRTKQAEHFTTQSGVTVVEAQDPEGGGHEAIGQLEDDDHVGYRPVNLRGIEALDLRVASDSLGGTVEVRAGGPDGELLGSADVGSTGGDQAWRTVRVPVEDPGRTVALHLVFRNPLLPPNPAAPQSMMQVNQITFVGTGLDSPPEVSGSAAPDSGTAPLDVQLSGSGTDPEGGELTWQWAPGDGTGTVDGRVVRHTYTEPGTYTAVVSATDPAGHTARDRVQVTVTEPPDTTPPEVTDPAPADESEVTDRWPEVGATVTDERSDIAEVSLLLDGEVVDATWDPEAARISYQPARPLRFGDHRARVIAEDAEGNVASFAWTFTVTR